MTISQVDNYFDLAAISSLKSDSQSASKATVDKVTKEFEALFIQMMLKSMRQTHLETGIFDSDQMRFYQDMYDQQIATDLAARNQLGLNDLLLRQIKPIKENNVFVDTINKA